MVVCGQGDVIGDTEQVCPCSREGFNGTSADGTVAEIPNNVSEQQLQPLQQQEPSALQQEQPPLQ